MTVTVTTPFCEDEGEGIDKVEDVIVIVSTDEAVTVTVEAESPHGDDDSFGG